MKKIFFYPVALISVLFASCSKDHIQNRNTSVIGKWDYIGNYSNGKVVSVPVTSNSIVRLIFNSDSSYAAVSSAHDTVSGRYAIRYGTEMVGGEIKSADSIVFYPAINYPMNILSPSYSSYYLTKKDTLFLFPDPKTSEALNYAIVVYIKNN